MGKQNRLRETISEALAGEDISSEALDRLLAIALSDAEESEADADISAPTESACVRETEDVVQESPPQEDRSPQELSDLGSNHPSVTKSETAMMIRLGVWSRVEPISGGNRVPYGFLKAWGRLDVLDK